VEVFFRQFSLQKSDLICLQVVAHTQGQEVLSEETVPLGAQTSPSLQSGLRNPSSPMTLLSSPTLLERQME